MKFLRPDGKVVESGSQDFCCGRICASCGIGKEIGIDKGASLGQCNKFITESPFTAAELMGYTVVVEKPNKPNRSSILESARKCVCGDRDEQYGSPENSFEAIGMFWGTYLWHKYNLGKQGNAVGRNFVTSEDVAVMMVLFKMARVATGAGKADNWIDAAGYAACGGEIEGGKQ